MLIEIHQIIVFINMTAVNVWNKYGGIILILKLCQCQHILTYYTYVTGEFVKFVNEKGICKVGAAFTNWKSEINSWNFKLNFIEFLPDWLLLTNPAYTNTHSKQWVDTRYTAPKTAIVFPPAWKIVIAAVHF